ncbi:unnamed protein product, partial [marine sediment metagenome]
FSVAEVFMGHRGRYVKIEDTIKSFRAIVEGKYDDVPEQAFYMTGNIEEVEERAKKLKESPEEKKEATGNAGQ